MDEREATKGILRNQYKRLNGVIPTGYQFLSSPMNFENKSHVMGRHERMEVTFMVDDPETMRYFESLFKQLFTKDRYIDMLVRLKDMRITHNDV